MMTTLLLILASLFSAQASSPGRADANASVPTYAFVNGSRFDGGKFVKGEFFSVRGTFSLRRPAHVDSVIDLHGKYVVPPFAEAHNHNIDGFKKVEERIQRYLAEGIFYVKNPNSIPSHTASLAGKINIPSSIDVTFSNGGLTATDGHPIELVRRNLGLGIFTEKDAEGGMYYTIDNADDLTRKWEAIIGDRPDFIKTYLVYSEEFAKRRDDTSYFGWKGLDPAVLKLIVVKAHAAGLRVSTHIESAVDFHNALMAGVDEINHMAGFRADSTLPFSRYEIAEEDARVCGERGVVVVTTLAGTAAGGSSSYQARLRRLHTRNLKLLKSAGVRLAIGSDNYRETSLSEALYLDGLKVFKRGELLNIWCDATAKTIFPRRAIGRLREGYEASFLVLDGNPVRDFSAVQKILVRFKQGRFLKVED